MPLRERIAAEIRERGPIPFSRYMELCLYDPEFGFYSRPREPFGKSGDFYTSSDVHAVFGRLLARQFDEMWRALDSPAQIELIELGPGRGLFAQDVLDWSKKKFPDFLHALRYRLVESSPALRQRLRARFSEQLGRGTVSIHASLEKLPPAANTIVFGNEFFDALPVEVISSEGQLYIAEQAGCFLERFLPPAPHVLDFLDRYGIHPGPGERVEAPLLAMEYMEQIAGLVRRGFVVLVDYGYTREELLAGRHRDTVMAYRRHRVSDTPYEAPGEQDITAHVNFTALREAGLAGGLEGGFVLTQSQFLMGIGESTQFADAFEETRLPQEQAKVALQLKHLVTPVGMGEIFQVLLMGKNIAKEKVMQLSGLGFARRCT
jgi:SAM-dependent MidA family methyltransferase